jgi:hypothetical protein
MSKGTHDYGPAVLAGCLQITRYKSRTTRGLTTVIPKGLAGSFLNPYAFFCRIIGSNAQGRRIGLVVTRTCGVYLLRDGQALAN